MAKTLVLTFIARDKPGLVERLSQIITEAGGNWLDSRMAHLASQFAGIARIEIPAGKVSSLEDALSGLDSEGIHVNFEEAADVPAPDGPVLDLDLVGPDHPGIVSEISRCLAQHGVSVEEMETDIRGSPMAGGALFYARARVRVPVRLSEDELRQNLEELASALMVDITLR